MRRPAISGGSSFAGRSTRAATRHGEFDSSAETELFTLIDADASGHIELEEIENAADDDRITDFVRKAKQPTLTHMMERSNHKGKHHTRAMARAFAIVDTDRGGHIALRMVDVHQRDAIRARAIPKRWMFINQNCCQPNR